MNLRLDRLVRQMARDPDLLRRAGDDPVAVAAAAGVTVEDVADVMLVDLAALHARGVHPLLLMQLAGATHTDPMEQLGSLPTDERTRTK
ncbi:hypothetical protein [Pseudonocardia sp. NPDC046786]|uniref:hypothetical protein n=1 Tax=Pseudonocardia sp. NPDC046786 TaxID=3155471 RepID=UPI0033F6D2E0